MLGLVGADVAVSTAVHDSARFPFLSPAGTLRRVGPRSGNSTDHDAAIVDGGYFENSGVTTASELAQWLASEGPRLAGKPVSPILVVATSDADPDTTGDAVPRCGRPPDDPSVEQRAISGDQLAAPLLTLLNTRSGHGSYAIAVAASRFCNDGFFHFHLHATRAAPIPLNWTLSEATADRIWRAIDAADDRDERRRLTAVLDRSPSSIPLDLARMATPMSDASSAHTPGP